MIAELTAAAWGSALLVASRVLPSRLGTQSVGGMPRWRNILAIPTQLLLLPLLYAMRADWTFTYVFALYMVMDFLLLRLEPIMVAHHLVCLAGHTITCLILPEGFGTYFLGVVALEVGSGTMNVWYTNHESRWCAALYVFGMSASNALGLYAAYAWVLLPLPLVPKVTNLVISLPLLALRQQALHVCMREGPEELRREKSAAAKDGVPPTPTSVQAMLWQDRKREPPPTAAWRTAKAAAAKAA